MRLSPVWVAVVAIAAPLGGTLSANAQTLNSSEQTAEVVIPEINQAIRASESLELHSNSTEVESVVT
ncbi:hypothetical protein, partial [Nodularia sphaerocarpa]